MGGESLKSRLAIARNLDGRLEIFGVDDNLNLWHAWEASPGGDWSGWSKIVGKRMRPGFAVGENKDGRLAVFGVEARVQNVTAEADSPIDKKQRIWCVWQQTPGGSFAKDWQDMGGSNLDPELMVGNTAEGRIQLIGTGSNHNVWLDGQLDSSDRWAGWADVGGNGVRVYALHPASK